jgi:hypothetical protein
VDRRRFIFAAVAAVQSCLTENGAVSQEASQMYGLIGKVTAVPGQRDALIALLIGTSANMAGCLSYVVAKDTAMTQVSG